MHFTDVKMEKFMRRWKQRKENLQTVFHFPHVLFEAQQYCQHVSNTDVIVTILAYYRTVPAGKPNPIEESFLRVP